MGTITFDGLKNASKIYRATDGGTTFSSTLHASAAFDYFLNSPSVNDAIYFCYDLWNPWTGNGRWHNIKVNVGTARTSAGAGVWEYHIGTETGGSWTELTCTDPTNGLTTTGSNTITFDIPDTWSNFRIGSTGEWYSNRLYIRYRLTDVTNIIEGGANATDLVQMNNWSIQITGSNGANPYTFDDIYDADVSGSWGVVTEATNAYLYTINCSLLIGDGSTATTFTDTYTTAVIGGILYVYANATFTLGSTATNGDARYGCQLIMKEPNSNSRSYSVCFSVAGATINIYDTLIRFANYTQIGNSTSGTFNFKSCKFCDTIVIHYGGTLTRCDYSNCNDGFRIGGTLATAPDDCKICSSTYGILFGWLYSQNTYTCRNMKIGSDVGTHLYFSGTLTSGSYFEVYDPEGLDTSRISKASGDYSTSYYRIYYSINLTVLDEKGNPITGATVTATNSNGDDYSDTTDSNGNATVEAVTRYGVLTSTLTHYDYSAITLKISAPGYETQTSSFTLDRKETSTIKLRQAIGPGRDEMGSEFR